VVYEVVSKILRSGATIYTAVVVARASVLTGQTVNSGFCCDVLRRLRENVRRRRPELWREQTWPLHRLTLPSSLNSFWRNKMAVIPHPPYSSDLVPCDFFLFPKMKLKLKGRRFGIIENIQAESQSAWHSHRKGLPGRVPKMEETVGPVSTWGRELLRGRLWSIGLMVSYDFYSVSPEYLGYTLV
jgi:hypothetical protein